MFVVLSQFFSLVGCLDGAWSGVALGYKARTKHKSGGEKCSPQRRVDGRILKRGRNQFPIEKFLTYIFLPARAALLVRDGGALKKKVMKIALPAGRSSVPEFSDSVV